MIARSPPAYLKPLFLGCDPPRAPAHLAVEGDRRALEPRAVVLADDLASAAEVEARRAVDRVEQLDELRRRRLAVREPEEVALRGWVQPAQERQDLVADQAALRARVRAVAAEVEALGEAVRLGVLAPAVEQRPDDAVRAAPVDLARRAARDDPVEDGLDLVGGGVARGAEPVGRERVADLAPLVLGASAAAVDDLGAERVAAELGVLVGLRVRAGRDSRAAPRRRYPSSRSTCQRQVESAPPETRHVTAPPGAISSCPRMSASTAFRKARGSMRERYLPSDSLLLAQKRTLR